MENKCNFYDGICKSPINKSDLECSLIPVERCYYKQLQQLKDYIKEDLAPTCQRLQKENEELQNSLGLANEYVNKYKATLDEIEGIAKNGVKDDCGMPLDELSIILQLIKQAKEGE